MCPKQTILWDRNGMISTGINQQTYVSLPALMDRAYGKQMLTTKAASGIDNSVTNILGTAFTTAPTEWQLSNPISKYEFRNLGVHPAKVTIYEVIARKDIPLTTLQTIQTAVASPQLSDMAVNVMQCLYTGWNEIALSTEVTSSGGGTLMSYTAPGTSCNNYGRYTPYESKTFCENYKIINKATKLMESGEVIRVKLSTKGRIMNTLTDELLSVTGTYIGTYGVYENCSKILLVEVEGTLLKSTSSDALVAQSTCDIAWRSVSSTYIRPYQVYKPSKAMRIIDRTTETGPWEGPTDYEEKEDNQ